ncbi:MAG: dihydropteroate synthase [bacterium]
MRTLLHPRATADLEAMRVGDQSLSWERTLVMGILNATPDSFSDGGAFVDTEVAVAHAMNMLAAGADIIDVGGESTRPGADAVSVDEEIARTSGIVGCLAEHCMVSIDTMKARVAESALDHGACVVNDVSALQADPDMAPLLADRGVPVVLMHMQGTPRTMQVAPTYGDVVEEVYAFFVQRLEACVKAGIHPSRVILDPGFGFGKTVEHNYALLWNLARFCDLGCPLLLGTSRKSMIGAVTGKPALEREFGTAATVALGIAAGANIVRVHNVPAMIDVVRVADAARGSI